MRKDREKAAQMRKGGKSYREIRAALKVPISTLSAWFGGEDWSQKVKKELSAQAREKHVVRLVELNKIRGERLARAYEEARKEARADFELLKYHPLFVAGVMLYWGEGGKSPSDGATLANTDPALVKLYVAFLSEICRVPLAKIKAHLLLYPDLEEMVCRSYWSKNTGIPWHNFTKSARMRERRKVRRLTWGVCTVSVSSLYFKAKMLEWLAVLPKELMDREYYASILGTAAAEIDADIV